MIASTEFIWVYNELFRFLEEQGDETNVIGFWEGIRENFLGNLRDYIREDGIRGMHKYWSHTLGEEGGRHHITAYDDELFVLKATMPGSCKPLRLPGGASSIVVERRQVSPLSSEK